VVEPSWRAFFSKDSILAWKKIPMEAFLADDLQMAPFVGFLLGVS